MLFSRVPAFVTGVYALAGIAALLATSVPAHAGVIDETEPNNTVATANQLVGVNDLGINGTLILSDIDEFTFRVQPATDGSVNYALDLFWAPASTTNTSQKWLNVVRVTPSGTHVSGSGTGTSGTSNSGSFQSSDAQGEAGIYRLSIFSTLINPYTASVPFSPTPSQAAGTYTIRNLRGLNGTTITGTATAPEPGSILLVLACSAPAIAVVKARRKSVRKAA